VQIVNVGDKEINIPLKISGFVPAVLTARVLTLAGPLDSVNTAANSESIQPIVTEWRHGLENGQTSVTLPAYSLTVIRF